VGGVGQLAQRVLQGATAKVFRLCPHHHPVEKSERPLRRRRVGEIRLDTRTTIRGSALETRRHELILAAEVQIERCLRGAGLRQHAVNSHCLHALVIKEAIASVEETVAYAQIGNLQSCFGFWRHAVDNIDRSVYCQRREQTERSIPSPADYHPFSVKPVKAFILDGYGSADRVRAGDMPEPELQEGDVMIQVHAAGVNPVDARIRDGDFKAFLRYRLPIVLGCDVAGVVVSVGSRVRRFKPGDEVYARTADQRIGAFAELIAINEDDVAIKPTSLTMEEAASIPLVGLTAWQALIERAILQRGQKVLIHAGSGGVGTFAIQLAKHIGATVATTTSTANVGLAKSLGADVVIDYRKEDFADTLRDYDVVLNSLDKATLEKSLQVLKPGGQLISISGPPDAAFARSLGLSWIIRTIMSALSYGIRAKAKRRRVSYSFLFTRADGGQLAKITSLIDEEIIRPVVDRVFPFASTKEAMAYVEEGRARGKVVVAMR
jgi:NADPH:quinone reductase-like Zn-dependent oxidoreductase